jgi:Secretion system C-terminal sorting domain
MKKTTLLMLIVFMTITAHGQNKLLSSIDENYDSSSSTWSIGTGANYEYDSNNNLIAETSYDYDSYSKKWTNLYKTSSTYTNGKLTENLYLFWNNSQWEYGNKDVYTYNINNLIDTYLFYQWDGSKWVGQSRTSYTYNANNKLMTSIDEDWTNSQWVNSYKGLFIYNANNQLESIKNSDWDGFTASWIDNGGTDYVYDANGNDILETYQDTYNGTLYRSKTDYTYDTSKLMSSYANPFGYYSLFGISPYVNKVLGETEYDYDTATNSYELNNRTTYNYTSSITLGTKKLEMPNVTITVFPNPTKDFLNIQNTSNSQINKVVITDITGKTVLQQEKNTTQLDVQNLAKGMYLLQISTGDEKWQSKFLKQ